MDPLRKEEMLQNQEVIAKLEKIGIDPDEMSTFIQVSSWKTIAKLETQLRKEYDQRMKEMYLSQQSLIDRFDPLNDLLSLMKYGKKLPQAIVDYVQENGLQMRLDMLRAELATKDEVAQVKKHYATHDHVDKSRYELQKAIDQLTVQIKDLDYKETQFGSDINYMRSMVTEKVDVRDIQRIEMKMEKLAPWEAVRNVFKELNLYLKREDMETFRLEMISQFTEFQHKIDKLVSRIEVSGQISELKTLVFDELENYSRIKNCANDKQETLMQMAKFKEEMIEFKKEFGRFENEQIQQRRAINLKADQETIEQILKDMMEHATRDDLKRLEAKVIPKICTFEDAINNFREEFLVNSEIIRRYDEVISEKASKFQIMDIQHQLHTDYARHDKMAKLEQKFEEISKLTEKLTKEYTDKLNAINETITLEIFQAVKKAIKQAQANQPVATQTGASGPSNLNMVELKQWLTTKANQTDLDRFSDIKANKVDLKHVMDMQQVLSRQIKHLLVLLMESVRNSLLNSETQYARENKNKFLLSQLNALAKWVMKFEPSVTSQSPLQDINSDAIFDGQESKELQEFTNLVLQDTQSFVNEQKNGIPATFQIAFSPKTRQNNIQTSADGERKMMFQRSNSLKSRRVSYPVKAGVTQQTIRERSTLLASSDHNLNNTITFNNDNSAEYSLDNEKISQKKSKKKEPWARNHLNRIQVIENKILISQTQPTSPHLQRPKYLGDEIRKEDQRIGTSINPYNKTAKFSDASSINQWKTNNNNNSFLIGTGGIGSAGLDQKQLSVQIDELSKSSSNMHTPRYETKILPPLNNQHQ